MDMTYLPSPNKNPRHGYRIDTIVLHATGGGLWPSINWLRNPNSGVSTHYVIAKNGEIYQLVEEDYMAWHAGRSQMPDGRTGVNWFSIGIELVNENDGVDEYPKDQLDALVKLLKDIVTRLSIKNTNIVTHAEIAIPTGRKSDPRNLDVREIKNRVYRENDYGRLIELVRWNIEESVREIEKDEAENARYRLLSIMEDLYRIERYIKGRENAE